MHDSYVNFPALRKPGVAHHLVLFATARAQPPRLAL